MDSTLSERLISLKEFADLLSVNPRTVYRLVESGRLPKSVRVGRSVRFKSSDVQAYFQALKQ